ncbi:MAG: hypothetical protein HYZ89_02405 [Candidatus Omnitrophica bacterium]|nr:hypothetical protein [Candidatus Omnitrophota bacterium]
MQASVYHAIPWASSDRRFSGNSDLVFDSANNWIRLFVNGLEVARLKQ